MGGERMPERFITVQEAAEQLQVHPQTVRVWLREGKLSGRLIGGRKSGYRIPGGAWGRPEGGAFTDRRAQPIRGVGELDASPSAREAGRRRGGLRPRRKRARLQKPSWHP